MHGNLGQCNGQVPILRMYRYKKLPIFLRTGTNVWGNTPPCEIFRRADDHFGAGRRRSNSRNCILTAAPAAG
eukprot:SAG11_NODE_38389_length_252_cov_1.104575_1_plen_71_part_01